MSETNDPDRDYLAPYERAVEEMGPGFEAQLWKNEGMARKRFEVIARALKPMRRPTIADLGCGTGGLLEHLLSIDQSPKRYIGIEGVAPMTDHARNAAISLGFDHAVFETHDFVADESLPRTLTRDAGVDAFVFSGSLNTLEEESARAVLARFYDALEDSGRGAMVFNFLSLRHDKERTPASAPARRFDPVAMLDFALDRTPIARLEHDYLKGHDATIVMRVPDGA